MSAKFNQTPYVTTGNSKYVTAKPIDSQAAYDQAEILQLANKEELRRRKILEEQKGIQSTRLNDLAKLLATRQDAMFNRDIPGIAETAQGQGFLETSGFGNALADRYKSLSADTSYELARQGLSDRDFEVNSLGEISTGTGDLNTSALQRKFSVSDQGRADDLARELGKMGVPAPAKGPSGTDKALMYGGPLLQGVAAIGGGGASYLCTKLVYEGLMTEAEKEMVHDKIFPYAYTQIMDLIAYHLYAPDFIANSTIDWSTVKPLLCDEVIACKTGKEAFEKYKSVCENLFFNQHSELQAAK